MTDNTNPTTTTKTEQRWCPILSTAQDHYEPCGKHYCAWWTKTGCAVVNIGSAIWHAQGEL
jgi:hypothetical protein